MSLENTSFKPAGSQDAFHVLSVRGKPKTGKTHLGLTAPGGIAVQSWDFGTQGVVQKFPDKVIYVAEYAIEIDLTADEAYHEMAANQKLSDEQLAKLRELAAQASDRQAAKITKEVWGPFRRDRLAAFTNPEIRTVMDDTATEMNEVLRLANFGKLEKNPQIAYGPINAEYKELVRMAHKYRKNLVLVHQVGKVWKEFTDDRGRTKNVETDEWKPQGNAKADYLVHTFVDTEYLPPVRRANGEVTREGVFKVKIDRARLNPSVNGMTLDNPDWATLMAFVAPDVPMENWL